jgi:hypothetical protein
VSILTSISPSSAQLPTTPVHGPRLAGVWQKLGIVAWAVIFLLCLAAFIMSISYGGLWYRTPYTDISQLDPTYEPAAIEDSLKPFQEAISNLGLTLDIYAHYFTLLRILAGLPYFILSFMIIRRLSDRLMAMIFAMALCLLGAAGTWYNPLWESIPESYPWHPFLDKLLTGLLFCSVIILYSFPDGRFVPRWTRWLALLVVPYAVVSYFALDDAPFNPWNWRGALAIRRRSTARWSSRLSKMVCTRPPWSFKSAMMAQESQANIGPASVCVRCASGPKRLAEDSPSNPGGLAARRSTPGCLCHSEHEREKSYGCDPINDCRRSSALP